MYKWLNIEHTILRRLADGACIPVVNGNNDYQDALLWAQANGPIPDPDPLTPAEITETLRLADLDTQINTNATLNALKVMTDAQFNTWWAANVTNLAQANVVLKLCARVILRRLL